MFSFVMMLLGICLTVIGIVSFAFLIYVLLLSFKHDEIKVLAKDLMDSIKAVRTTKK